MLWTLQWYIFRELGKSFLLWAVGLTLVFALCGGVMNMIQVEGASTLQMTRILGFILPVATTLTLPVAALVSTALTYGRVSADNEFVACRSSGINIHRLFAPAVTISVFTAMFTFSFSNFVIPEFVRGLDLILRKDLHKLVSSELNRHGHLPFQKYVMHVDGIQGDEGMTEDGQANIMIEGGAFIELSGTQDEVIRFGTVKSAVINFDNTGTSPRVRADLNRVRGYDREQKQFFEEAHQEIGPFPIPRTLDEKAKWLDLPKLLYYRNHPEEYSEIRKQVGHMRVRLREILFYRQVIESMSKTRKFALESPRVAYELEAHSDKYDESSGRPTFKDVTVVQQLQNRTRRITADRATFEVLDAAATEIPGVRILLNDNVQVFDTAALDPQKAIPKNREDLLPVPMPQDVLDQVATYSDASLLHENLQLGEQIENQRIGMQEEIVKTVLEITGIVHARNAFSASVLVLVVLGAALGIIFRGADYLTAFFVAFLPGIFITVAIVMGRQMTENVNTSLIGICVMWGVIVLVGLADGYILTRVLRR
jgi:lipopolysaccharide export LptBFGC system permease protein LptF